MGVLLRIIWVVAVVGVVTLMDGKWRCILWGLLLLLLLAWIMIMIMIMMKLKW